MIIYYGDLDNWYNKILRICNYLGEKEKEYSIGNYTDGKVDISLKQSSSIIYIKRPIHTFFPLSKRFQRIRVLEVYHTGNVLYYRPGLWEKYVNLINERAKNYEKAETESVPLPINDSDIFPEYKD